MNTARTIKRKAKRGDTKSYPVIITNVSADTLEVGYGEYLSLIIEAKDSLENWMPIQERFFYKCATGLMDFHLPPDEIIISSIKHFSGPFETKMRIAFGRDRKIKSNEFIGSINYEQFTDPEHNYQLWW